MFRLQRKGWPQSVASKNETALKQAASATVQFIESLRSADKPGKDTQFMKIIRQGTKLLFESVMSGSGSRPEYELDLNKAGDAFLNIATDIETLLMDLLLEEEKTLYVSGQGEISSMMERMALASAVK